MGVKRPRNDSATRWGNGFLEGENYISGRRSDIWGS